MSEATAGGPPGLEAPLRLPDTLPVLPLLDSVVYPMAAAPLLVGQERSVRLVDDAMRAGRLLALVAPRRAVPQPGPDDLYRTGTAALIQRLARTPEGALHLVVQGLERIRLVEFVATEPYLVARVVRHPDRAGGWVEADVLRRTVLDLFRRLVRLSEDLPAELVPVAEALPGLPQLAYLVAAEVPLDLAARQEILELDPAEAKLRRLVELLQHELPVRELSQKIIAATRQQISKEQREHYLREQLRAIRRELGEDDEGAVAAQLRERLEAAGLPPAAREEAERELRRLETIPLASPEHAMIRTYLEWLAALPWRRPERPPIDVALARRILDEDHYGLERVKERILEHLAVLRLRQQAAGAGQPASAAAPGEAAGRPSDWHEPILCFLGPPGVGKTSLGQSIARALGREFVRVSLGGVHDEAEIRGHRRTYIGALPGRILQALRRVRTADPVFMLDEVDKLGAGLQGSPAAALLEVLDPSQNDAFVDNYLGVPYDLSGVLFLCTANSTEGILPALLDRMEILELPGYTDEEKVEISRRYLIPRAVRAHGLPFQPEFEEAAIRRILREYTREPGVRQLDRQLGSVVRKLARQVVEGAEVPRRITAADVPVLLGRRRFFDEVAERVDRPGVAAGLAWTPSGGDLLFVEAAIVPAQEERLILTGMLGEVMRESAAAALTYLRSQGRRLGIDPEVFRGKTVHVHVPAGAVPKDGPSAGVTILTALASLATERVVRPDLAMTGEITLRGKVLPVGGIPEKLLAAHRAGLRTVLLPRLNLGDAEEVPRHLRDRLEIVPIQTAEEVLRHALGLHAAGAEAEEAVAAVADRRQAAASG
jgi:ATP-dependent Lon protease